LASIEQALSQQYFSRFHGAAWKNGGFELSAND
jgi:hypothetical protein